MPLNSSGPISIGGSTVGQSINLELGRAAGASSNLNETALRNLAVVASGAISLSNFYGKSNSTFNIALPASTFTQWQRVVSGAGATSSITLLVTGGITLGTGVTGPAAWGSPVGGTPGTGWWVRATTLSGFPSSGTVGSWLKCDTNPAWSVSQSVVGIKAWDFKLDFSTNGGTTTAFTASNLELYAERTT
ncbi:MAG: hypothetical protein KGI52_16725 [Burkholderiales bacterium]|nr:hypothetical protein [Burkholderiales bacterium]